MKPVMDPGDDSSINPLTPGTPRSEADRAAAARLLELLHAGGDARTRKVRRIRAAIRCTAYENDLKFSVAVDRLAGDVEG